METLQAPRRERDSSGVTEVLARVTRIRAQRQRGGSLRSRAEGVARRLSPGPGPLNLASRFSRLARTASALVRPADQGALGLRLEPQSFFRTGGPGGLQAGAWRRGSRRVSALAMSRASANASSRGVSLVRLARPSSTASLPDTMRPVKVSSLATSSRTRWRSVWVAVMSGISPQLDLAHRELRVRRHDAQVRGQRDLQAAAVGYAVDRRDHRNRQLLPDPRRELRDVVAGVPSLRASRSISGVALRALLHHRGEALEVQTRAERAALSREHHGAQRWCRPASERPASVIASNIGMSSAFSLSGRGSGARRRRPSRRRSALDRPWLQAFRDSQLQWFEFQGCELQSLEPDPSPEPGPVRGVRDSGAASWARPRQEDREASAPPPLQLDR